MGRDRIVLVAYTTGYGGQAFVEAARRLGAEVVMASDRCPILDRRWQWPRDSLVIDFYDPAAAAAVIVAAARSEPEAPVRAILPVGGEVPALVAALAARQLGLPCNDPRAVAAAGNKLRMRELCAGAVAVGGGGSPANAGQAAAGRSGSVGAGLVPRFLAVPFDADPMAAAAQVGASIGWPCVVKPLLLSASRGVMRADDPGTLEVALRRLHRLLSAPELLEMDPLASRQVLIESFVPGPEVALEGVLSDGALHTLALFDKPDPLDGPFFEETIYVTPSRHSTESQAAIQAAVVAAARAMGLVTGPVHAELRLGAPAPVVIELAARPIGGLCSRTLRFSGGWPLEELLIRQALGQDVGHAVREPEASGVMMIPIPKGGILRSVSGVAAARAVPGVDDLVISARVGERLIPLPEGSSYLGFIFARGESPAVVEGSLREAHGRLSFDVADRLPVGGGLASPTAG
jgi:biotin carboxylase